MPSPPGVRGCHHPQLSVPFPCQSQCTSCSTHSSCSLTSRNTAALGLRSHHPEHWAHGQLCPVPRCWLALEHRHWFGVGAPAPILGRGTWHQFPSPAVGEPCFAQALLPLRTPHTALLSTVGGISCNKPWSQTVLPYVYLHTGVGGSLCPVLGVADLRESKCVRQYSFQWLVPAPAHWTVAVRLQLANRASKALIMQNTHS